MIFDTAAYRMARDPQMPLTDVRWVLGHAQLSTTQLYVSPLPADVIANVLAFHQRGASRQPQVSPPSLGYRPGIVEHSVQDRPVTTAGSGRGTRDSEGKALRVLARPGH
jgi:hypothetical protein